MDKRVMDRAAYALNEAVRLLEDLPFHSPTVPRDHGVRVLHRKFTFSHAPGQMPYRHRVSGQVLDVEPQHEAEFLQIIAQIETLNEALLAYIEKASPPPEEG